MSAVNVLAVMNDCRNDLDAARMVVAAKELAKARAAVAELIEAAELARDYIEGLGVHLADGAGKANLRAALARVGGAA